ncbi:alpha/beta fold hydrolase [Parvularcula lutaonensis]|uniref:Alpha/beta fold hydrolase n=1 Tax=Parvularcula lutaonensis TaxID=491923 RepID=A0ABV7M9J6_9PROT|nr:alpha/beta hydrolase [Parvularcula lutaonensis]GGY47331.1 alpha/beta hydrolase [Parvularcula lutaonensis]
MLRRSILKAGAAFLALCALPAQGFAGPTDGPGWTKRIEVNPQGKGRDIVFVPGLTSSPKVFARTTRDLPGELHFVTVKGFAGTEAPAELDPFVLPAAMAVSDYLEAEGITDAAIVGHSMGGIVAMLAANDTDRVSRVLIVDSVPFLPALFQPNVSPEAIAATRPLMKQQMKNLTREMWMATVRQGLPGQAISQEARERILKASGDSDFEAAKAAFVDLMTTDYSADFEAVTVPITVLVPYDERSGFARDLVVSRYEAQYADVPDVEIRVIDDSRHFIMFDQPDVFRAELERFLAKED